jgi:hypothetical protein
MIKKKNYWSRGVKNTLGEENLKSHKGLTTTDLRGKIRNQCEIEMCLVCTHKCKGNMCAELKERCRQAIALESNKRKKMQAVKANAL